MTQTQKHLFQEFPAVSPAEWKTRASAELKETPYERIVWHTPDGFDIEPWYAAQNAHALPFRPAASVANNWRNCRCITVNDPRQGNREAIESFAQDVTALEFRFTEPHLCTKEQIGILLKDISIPAVAIYFSGRIDDPSGLLEILASIPEFSENTGALLAGLPEAPHKNDRSLFETCNAIAGFRFLAIDTTLAHEQGATPSQEIALALAAASDLLHRFTGHGVDPERIVSAMEIVMAAGSSHFSELSKPRALRALLPHLCTAYGAKETARPGLFARASRRNRSLLDPFTNVLRQTTETVSAVLGGYDTLQIDPFDSGLSVTKEDAERISGNIHLILRKESFLDRVADPAAGSHYIETMTAGLAESAWKFFLAIESAGGLAVAEKNGVIEAAIAQSASARRKALESRKKNLIGVNRYPWPLTPRQEENIRELYEEAEAQPEGSETRTFELLRLKAEAHRIKAGRVPSVFIWMSGDPAISFRQAAFAEDFFSCGGFAVSGTALLDAGPEGFAAALRQSPEIIVLCIAEKDPIPTAEAICRGLRDLQPAVIPVMAGKPPAESAPLFHAGLDSFIHTGVNVLEMLQSYHHKTGIQ